MARTRRGSAALRTAPFSALQSGPRLSRQRNVRPGDALLPGSAERRAALFPGPPGSGLPPPHGQLVVGGYWNKRWRRENARIVEVVPGFFTSHESPVTAL